MRRWVPLLVVAGLLILAGSVAISVTQIVDRAVLRARVQFLERALSQRAGWTEAELAELEATLQRIAGAQVAPPERVLALVSEVERLEGTLAMPVISSTDAHKYVGKLAAIYGKVTRVTRKGHLWADLPGLGLVWFNGEREVPELREGCGVVVVGVVTEYQGAPQIRLNNAEQIVIAAP